MWILDNEIDKELDTRWISLNATDRNYSQLTGEQPKQAVITFFL